MARIRTKKIGITLSEETIKNLEEMSKKLQISKTSIITLALNEKYIRDFRKEKNEL